MKKIQNSRQMTKGRYITRCYYCLRPKNVTVHLDAYRVMNHEPCDACYEKMERGILIAEVPDGQTGKPEPLRTGRRVIISEAKAFSTFTGLDFKKDRFFFMGAQLFERVFGHVFTQ